MQKVMKKVLLLLLACLTALPLTACGASGSTAAAPQSNESTEQSTFRYLPSYTPVKDAPFDGLYSEFYTEDGLYASCTTYENGNRTVSPVFISYDGTIKEFPAYTSAKTPTGNEGNCNYFLSESILSLAPLAGGKLLALIRLTESWNDDPEVTRTDLAFYENYHEAAHCLARILDADGRELSSFAINAGKEEADGKTALVMADGNFLFAADHALLAYSPEGQLLWQYTSKDYIQQILTGKDGTLYFSCYDSKGLALTPFDAAAQKPGKAIRLPNSALSLSVGAEHDFIYSSGPTCYGIDLASSEEGVKLFSWLDLDIATFMDHPVYTSADGSLHGYIREDGSGDFSAAFRLFRLEKVSADAVKEKKTLTLATLGLDYETKQQIVKFNRDSDDYHIEIKDYSRVGGGEDLSAGALKLQTEILAGNSPDLLDLSEIAVDRLAAKGLLEDLYPYLDADAELKREDFLPNVLAAAENNGKLVSTVSGFSIVTLAGAQSVVGDTVGWTYDACRSALADMPEGCTALDPSTTRTDILNTCLMLDLNHFVDWATGSCSFEGEEFTSLLEFAKTFPAEEKGKDGAENADPFARVARIAEGSQMLIGLEMNDFSTSWVDSAIFTNQPYTYIGYPTAHGDSGNYISMNAGIAMSSSCREKDGAWQFLRAFFTEDYQRGSSCIPSNKAALEYKLASAMEMHYEKDADGAFLLDDNGEKIPQPVFEYSIAGYDIVYYALMPEVADQLLSLINGTTRILNFDANIIDIVDGQAEAFFQGQKSAEEVARLVQSKLNIYVNEQR